MKSISLIGILSLMPKIGLCAVCDVTEYINGTCIPTTVSHLNVNIDFSTITTALNGKQSSTSAVPAGNVDLSTVTTALAGKLGSNANATTASALFAAGTLAASGDLCRGVDASGNCVRSATDATTAGVSGSTLAWTSGAAFAALPLKASLNGATFTGASGITNVAFTATGSNGNIISASSITTSGGLFGTLAGSSISGTVPKATAANAAGTTAASGDLCVGVDTSWNCIRSATDNTTAGISGSTLAWRSGAAFTALALDAKLTGATFTGASGITNAAFTATGASGNIIGASSITTTGSFFGVQASLSSGITASSGSFIATGGNQYSIVTSSGINITNGTLLVNQFVQTSTITASTGFFLPALTQTQVNQAKPLIGMLIYNSTKNQICYSTGTTIMGFKVVGSTWAATCK